MARSQKSPKQWSLAISSVQPDQATRPIAHLANCNGLNKSITPEQMGVDDAADLENFFLNDAGKLQIRGGTAELGDAATEEITHVAIYQRGDKTRYIVRWLKTLLQYYNNGVWTSFTGAALPFSVSTRISHAAWGSNTLLFVGNSKVWSADFTTFALTEIAASPANSQQVFVFGNRVCVCSPGTNYTTIQWSIKNDSTDWTGQGSGNEPLIPGPVGSGDAVLGGFPVSDTEALILRTNSVWIQTITGNVDVPFNFSFLYRVSLRDVHSAALAIGGIYIYDGDSDVWLLTTGGPKSIGAQIKNKYILDLSNTYGVSITDVAGAYDEYRQVYYLYIPRNVAFTNSEILVYHERQQGWTTFNYPLQIGRICALNEAKDAVAPNDVPVRGPIISTLGGSGDARIVIEDPDSMTDVADAAGTTQDMIAFATLAALRAVTWGRRVRFQDLTIDIDGGTQSQLTVAVNLFTPSRFNDVSLETINLVSSSVVQTSRLRQRKTFVGVRERNGIVPQVVFTASPMLSLNSIDINQSDGAPFIEVAASPSDERITVSLDQRVTVGGDIRIAV